MARYFYSTLIGAVMALGLGNPVRAVENWTVFDLGTARTSALCVNAGRESLLAYAYVFGARRIEIHGSTLFAWGLARAKNDGILICAEAGNRTVAQLIIYSDDNSAVAALTQTIAEGFWEHLDRMTQDMIDEANRRNGF